VSRGVHTCLSPIFTGLHIQGRSKAPSAAYFHSPAEFRTSTESEAVIGRELCDVGQCVWAKISKRCGGVFRSFRHQRCVGMGFFGNCGFEITTELNLA